MKKLLNPETSMGAVPAVMVEMKKKVTLPPLHGQEY